jgi:signal transduction histidine kinase
MNVLSRKSLGSALLILFLAAVLVVLGRLQYRSTEQVSEATALDMEESLQSALFDFRHALERELSGLCLELQPRGESASAANPKELAYRLNQWRQTTEHSSLVGDIFLWEGRPEEEPLRISANGSFKSSAWPSTVAGLPERLIGISSDAAFPSSIQSSGEGPHAVQAVLPGKAWQFSWMLDQESLTLVHPAVVAAGAGKTRIIWLMVPLERQFLVQHLLPELAGHQFGGHGENYKVAVILDGATPNVVYSSESGFGTNQHSAFDARLNLFGPPSITRETSLTHQSGVIIPALAEPANELPHLFIDPLVPAPEGPNLVVIAQHRQGSLEAAVARLRQRNLAVSFGLLGVLAVTFTLLIFTSQRARDLAQMQMDFVAGVSHELRTPLTAIMLSARNLEDGVVGEKALARYGTAIKSQAAHLSGLVEEILLFSETHSGRHIYKIEAVDVPLGIDNTIEQIAPLIHSSGFTVEQNVDAELPLAVGDNAAFSQCLQNLITNSLKYGGANKWIGVRAFVSRNTAAKEVCVSVEDRGLGIEANELKQIFEPFYRSPEVVAAQIHGNGLGLPLTKTMVEAMKGKITVSSQPGKGSIFTIHLRAA